MRSLIAVTVAAMIATPAMADTMAHCASAWKSMEPDAKAKTTYQAYSASCLKSGSSAMGVTLTAAPNGATGMCKDNTYTMAKTHADACSRHGGVAKWY